MGRRHINQRRRRFRREKQRGAAMIVIMMVLLAATSTAVFAVHSTSQELRAAGYQRQAMQSEYTAEAGLHAVMAFVDQAGQPSMFNTLLNEDAYDSDTCGNEPSISQGAKIKLFDLSADGQNKPVDREGIGSNQSYTPNFSVCLYGQRMETKPAIGGDSGKTQYRYILTSYSSLILDTDGDGASDDTEADDDGFNGESRGQHQVIHGARAHIQTTPE